VQASSSSLVQLCTSVFYVVATAVCRMDGEKRSGPAARWFYAGVFFLVNATYVCLI